MKRYIFVMFIATLTSLNATVIDFNGLAGTAVPGNTSVNNSAASNYSYTEFYQSSAIVSGFEFYSAGYKYLINSNYGNYNSRADNGTDFLMMHSSADTTMIKSGNEAFDLTSLDITDWIQGANSTLLITGELVAGGTVVESVELESGVEFTNYVLNWSGLASVNFHGEWQSRYIAYDNLVVNENSATTGTSSATPEPSFYSLLMIGFLGLAFCRQKQQRALNR